METKSAQRCFRPTLCEHGRRKTRCLECSGGSFCDHQLLRYRCKQCKGVLKVVRPRALRRPEPAHVDLRRCKALNVNRLLVSGLYPSPPRALSELTSVTARPIGAAATAFAFSPGQCQAGPDVPSGQLKHGAATPFGPSVYQSAGIQKAPPRRSALWPARVCNLERAPSATDISDKVYPAQPMHLSVVPSHLPPSPGGRVLRPIPRRYVWKR